MGRTGSPSRKKGETTDNLGRPVRSGNRCKQHLPRQTCNGSTARWGHRGPPRRPRVQAGGDRWIFPGIGWRGAVARVLVAGSPLAGHAVDVSDAVDVAVASLSEHRAYLEGLGGHPMSDPEWLRWLLAGVGVRAGCEGPSALSCSSSGHCAASGRSVAAVEEPFDRLAGHRRNEVEVLVEMQHRQAVEFGVRAPARALAGTADDRWPRCRPVRHPPACSGRWCGHREAAPPARPRSSSRRGQPGRRGDVPSAFG